MQAFTHTLTHIKITAAAQVAHMNAHTRNPTAHRTAYNDTCVAFGDDDIMLARAFSINPRMRGDHVRMHVLILRRFAIEQ